MRSLWEGRGIYKIIIANDETLNPGFLKFLGSGAASRIHDGRRPRVLKGVVASYLPLYIHMLVTETTVGRWIPALRLVASTSFRTCWRGAPDRPDVREGRCNYRAWRLAQTTTKPYLRPVTPRHRSVDDLRGRGSPVAERCGSMIGPIPEDLVLVVKVQWGNEEGNGRALVWSDSELDSIRLAH